MNGECNPRVKLFRDLALDSPYRNETFSQNSKEVFTKSLHFTVTQHNTIHYNCSLLKRTSFLAETLSRDFLKTFFTP